MGKDFWHNISVGVKEFGDKLILDLKNEFIPSLSKKEQKKIRNLEINIVVSPDILDVNAYQLDKSKYIDISTAFLDAINKVTDDQVIEEIIGRKTFVFNFIYYYLFSQAEIRPTIQNYAELNKEELAIFNSPKVQTLRYDMFKYGVDFVLVHELAHHIEKHKRKDVKSEE